MLRKERLEARRKQRIEERKRKYIEDKREAARKAEEERILQGLLNHVYTSTVLAATLKVIF